MAGSALTVAEAASRKWDAIVIGGGHNGLVAASYLARAGLKAVVLERRHLLGGAAVTETVVPGYRFSRASYVQGLFRPQIAEDLALHSRGYKVLPRDPCSYSPLRDCPKSLVLGSDAMRNEEQIAAFSKQDAKRFSEYNAMIATWARVLVPLLDCAPFDFSRHEASYSAFRVRERMGSAWDMAAFGARLVANGMSFGQLQQIVAAPAEAILRRYFESEPLLATLATDSIIGSFCAPSTPGSALVLMHHHLGPNGQWGYVGGGMGSLSNAIADALYEAGGCTVTNAEVSRVVVNDGGPVVSAEGVQLADGTVLEARAVLGGVNARDLFLTMLEDNVLEDDFAAEVRQISYGLRGGAVMKINCALDRLPQFKNRPSSAAFGGIEHPELRGTIHLGCESLADISQAWLDGLANKPSVRPVIEMTVPSIVDDSLAPPGHAVAGLFVQYMPYDLPWEDKKFKDNVVNNVLNVVEEYAPGFRSSIVGMDALSPKDLEGEFGLPFGNIFHGELIPSQMFGGRPVPGFHYRTPVRNLYLCGSSVHPGGGVMGAPGRNCSRFVLRDFSQRGEAEAALRMLGAAKK